MKEAHNFFAVVMLVPNPLFLPPLAFHSHSLLLFLLSVQQVQRAYVAQKIGRVSKYYDSKKSFSLFLYSSFTVTGFYLQLTV
jgi:hypothetical protein